MQGMKLIRIDCMLEREAAAEDRAHRHCDCHRDEATLKASEVAWPAFSVDEGGKTLHDQEISFHRDKYQNRCQNL